jgi:hypothetical protein
VTAPPFDPLPHLTASGLSGLDGYSSVAAVTAAVRAYVDRLNGAGPLDEAAAKAAALRECKAHEVRNGRELVLAAFAERRATVSRAVPPHGTVTLGDPDPALEPQDGAALLDDLATWLAAYMHLLREVADAAALWAAATWYVEVADFAPVLAVLSPTKRCGKSLLLELLSRVVRRGYATSGSGVTTAVVFRLNEALHPTLCIDEAEKLSGRHADRELIGLLNAGYRRGARVQRCVERDGDFVVREFDAFGFRALAAIRGLWDTVTDRALVVWLERKPASARVRRFAGRVADAEGAALARRFARWTADTQAAVGEALGAVPRPDWLHDRACDNWATVFAVAHVAGADWLKRALAAARQLDGAAEERDHTELIVHDLWRLWNVEQWADAVASGQVVEKLNDLETSPWGTYRDGKGLTTHGLAALLRSLGVRPRQARNAKEVVVRGYWLADLQPVFTQYPPPPELVQLVQVVQKALGHDWVVPVVPPVPVGAGSEGDVSRDPDADARDAMREGA